ncbi:MAG: hypothetical protein N2482_01525 [Patescibacteria group bacterium]|nr:hypothetical protein [Patescibacteria group bacterium]
MLPQHRGALVANAQANKLPEGCEQNHLLELRNNGLDIGDYLQSTPSNGDYPLQGRLNSGKRKLSPQQRAERVAQEMLNAGKSPQEIGAVVAEILGFES